MKRDKKEILNILSSEIFLYCLDHDIKPWQINKGEIKNPFPVGTNYFYMIYKQSPDVPLKPLIKMLDFFNYSWSITANKNE